MSFFNAFTYMFTCVYIYIYIHVYVCVYLDIHVYMNTHTHICIYNSGVFIKARENIEGALSLEPDTPTESWQTGLSMNVCVCMFVCMRVCVCVLA